MGHAELSDSSRGKSSKSGACLVYLRERREVGGEDREVMGGSQTAQPRRPL